MGVPGLQSFLKANPSLATQAQLNDTSLIIDANNLLCVLFCELCTSRESDQWRCDVYNGDLVAYSQVVREFFSSLDKCNITPVLVFDGSVIGKQSTKDTLVLKEQAIYRRGIERFHQAKDFTEHRPTERSVILPQTINHAFKNVVMDLGIQRIQTPYEADSHIARLANELDCIVLTNDSDFIIYSLPKGFIMIDLLPYKDLKKAKSGTFFMQCPVFSQERIFRKLPGLKPENMPLLSVFTGNDYVEPGTFDRVLHPIWNQAHSAALQIFKTESMNHKKIANLLNWLQKMSQEEAIELVLSQLQSGNRDKLRSRIRILLRNYEIESTDNFDSELDAVYPPDRVDPNANTNPGLTPAAYLRKLMETSDLMPLVLDIIFHNPYYNYAIIDDHQLVSSSFVKYRPFSVATTLLRPQSYSNMTSIRRRQQMDQDAFYLFDRVQDQYQKIIIRPVDRLEEFKVETENLNMYTLITLEPALKKIVLMATFRFNIDEFSLMSDTVERIFTGEFVLESAICMMLVKYIGLETKDNPKPQFVDALMLTLFFYAALEGKLSKNLSENPQYGHLLLKLRPYSIKKYFRSNEQPCPLYRRIVHFISQLQSAYISYCVINSLLDHVFQVPRYEKFMNGTLIYRLTKFLRTKQLDLESLCQELPILFDACTAIRTMVHCRE